MAFLILERNDLGQHLWITTQVQRELGLWGSVRDFDQL